MCNFADNSADVLLNENDSVPFKNQQTIFRYRF